MSSDEEMLGFTRENAAKWARQTHGMLCSCVHCRPPRSSEGPVAETGSRNWDGSPESPADTKSWDLRQSGWPVDGNGDKVTPWVAAQRGAAAAEYAEALLATLKAAGAGAEELAAARREALTGAGADPGPCTACKGTGAIASSAGPTGSQYRKCRACG